MITIFNGRRRTTQSDEPDIYIQVSVALRRELHRFWNGKNANAYLVFSAIALHADAQGWAWPSFALLKGETGIARKETLTAALRWLVEIEIEGAPVLRVYRRLEGGKYRGNVYHIFPQAGGAAPGLRGQLAAWEPGTDEPDPDRSGPDEPSPLKKSQTPQAQPAVAAAAALAALHVTVPVGPRKFRDGYTERCPHCGEQLTQAADHCPGCQTAVIWKGSRLADGRAKIQRNQTRDALARHQREQETYLSPLTGEILGIARADSVKERYGARISYNRQTKEEQRLADYERAFGAAEVRRLAHAARGKAQGRGMIVALLQMLEAYRPAGARRARPTTEAGKVWDDDYYTM